MLQIKLENPPNIEEIRARFTLRGQELFCYSPYLYNPSDSKIDEPLIKHEIVHALQQGKNPKEWWERYLVDIDFRLSQEIPAYQTQYKEAKSSTKDRNKLFKYAHNLAMDLSGDMYGNIIGYQEALTAIRSTKLITFEV